MSNNLSSGHAPAMPAKTLAALTVAVLLAHALVLRSEERRVGKECA